VVTSLRRGKSRCAGLSTWSRRYEGELSGGPGQAFTSLVNTNVNGRQRSLTTNDSRSRKHTFLQSRAFLRGQRENWGCLSMYHQGVGGGGGGKSAGSLKHGSVFPGLVTKIKRKGRRKSRIYQSTTTGIIKYRYRGRDKEGTVGPSWKKSFAFIGKKAHGGECERQS